MTGGRQGSGRTILSIRLLYQGVVNALPPWPYGPIVLSAQCVRAGWPIAELYPAVYGSEIWQPIGHIRPGMLA